MALWLVVAATVLVVDGEVSARSRPRFHGKSKGGGALRAKRRARKARMIVSPDRKHWIELARRDRRVLLDGRVVNSPGRPVTLPLWRVDSRALAYVGRCPRRGMVAVVFPDVTSPRPLIWRLPALVGRRPRLFWIGRQRIGIGSASLVPRVVLSWTTQIARR